VFLDLPLEYECEARVRDSSTRLETEYEDEMEMR